MTMSDDRRESHRFARHAPRPCVCVLVAGVPDYYSNSLAHQRRTLTSEDEHSTVLSLSMSRTSKSFLYRSAALARTTNSEKKDVSLSVPWNLNERNSKQRTEI
jgi:hypothetical protein